MVGLRRHRRRHRGRRLRARDADAAGLRAPDFFDNQFDADSVVVHELAHQWVGDSLALVAWQHTRLNEGFATYTEWLWSEHDGLATAQEIFDDFATIPADDPFWSVVIGDAGGNVATPQFIELAEQVSGQGLDDFFQTWLFTPAKPAGIEPQGAGKRRASRFNVQALLRKAVKR